MAIWSGAYFCILWTKHSSFSLSYPLFFIWGIWKYRNLILFEDIHFNFKGACRYILQFFIVIPKHSALVKSYYLQGSPVVVGLNPTVFFDEANQRGRCGAWIHLILSKDHHVDIYLGCGEGSNT